MNCIHFTYIHTYVDLLFRSLPSYGHYLFGSTFSPKLSTCTLAETSSYKHILRRSQHTLHTAVGSGWKFRNHAIWYIITLTVTSLLILLYNIDPCHARFIFHMSDTPPARPRSRDGLVYWGLTPQQQPGSYQGGEMMIMKSVFWWRKPEYPEETSCCLKLGCQRKPPVVWNWTPTVPIWATRGEYLAGGWPSNL